MAPCGASGVASCASCAVIRSTPAATTRSADHYLMADPPNNQKKPDMSMEQRLLLAFVLMGLVLLVSQYFYKPSAPQRRSDVRQTEPAKPAAQAVKPEEPVAPITATAEPAAQVAAQAEEMPRVDTD